jgi:hypothetical protein
MDAYDDLPQAFDTTNINTHRRQIHKALENIIINLLAIYNFNKLKLKL